MNLSNSLSLWERVGVEGLAETDYKPNLFVILRGRKV